MIKREELLDLNFYKKACFTGSYRGMRYKIEKENGEDGLILKTTIWPEPYGGDATADDQKEKENFTFDENGLENITDWLNKKWKEKYS